MPSPIAISSPRTISGNVTDARSPTWALMERPVRMEVPKSPCSNAPIQSAYCAISGRSRPSCERSAATRSGGEFSPAITEATSPGSTRNAANTTMEMPNSAAANSSSLPGISGT